MKARIAFLATIFITFLVNNSILNAATSPFTNGTFIAVSKIYLLPNNYILNHNDFTYKLVSETNNISKKNSNNYQYTYGAENLPDEEVLDVKTLLDDISVNNMDSITKDELIKKEIQKLNQELDELNYKLHSLRKENQQLKNEIGKIYNEDRLKEEKESLIEKLKNEARVSKINLDISTVPDTYISALDLLVIGNIELAQKQFLDFVKNNSKNKKNKEYLSSTSANNASKFIAYSYYWLGKINNINMEYKAAIENYSLAYKFANFDILSLISLVGLIETLTNFSKTTEACTAIKQFMQDYEKVSNDKSFNLDPFYLKLVENYKSINKCQ